MKGFGATEQSGTQRAPRAVLLANEVGDLKRLSKAFSKKQKP